MAGPDGATARLATLPLPAPLHLAAALLRYRALGIGERIATWRVARAAARPDGSLAGTSVADWLASLGQGARSRSRLWDPLTFATLNADPALVPADLLAVVLREGLLSGGGASRVGLATVGLSDLHGEPSKRFVELRGGEVRRKTAVKGLVFESGRLAGVRLADGGVERARAVISALPPPQLRSLAADAPSLAGFTAPMDRLNPSPIVSVHAWLRSGRLRDPFVGFWDQELHWAFDKQAITGDPAMRHLSLVTSAAGRMMSESREGIRALCERELRHVTVGGSSVERVVVVRENEATWVPPIGDGASRLGSATPVANFFVSGDWTATGLPATIEGAVRSGHAAARLAERLLNAV
jgi:hypothetical protein